jgi:hypothetical protein
MKQSTIKKAVALATLSSAFVLGCELIVDFDRTRIPVEGSDASTADVVAPPATDAGGTTDASDDGAAPGDAGDAGSSDASADADAS